MPSEKQFFGQCDSKDKTINLFKRSKICIQTEKLSFGIMKPKVVSVQIFDHMTRGLVWNKRLQVNK